MQEIKTVAILGAGAMGAVYASLFYKLDPASVSLVAAGERAERLKRDGITVNGVPYKLPVRGPGDDAPPADLVLVALKHHHLPEAVPLLAGRVGEHTAILSVMNGLDSENVLAEAWGREKVLYAVAVGIDAVRGDQSVNYSKTGKVFFGEAENRTPTPRVLAIQRFLGRAGLHYETPDDMIRVLWWKFMINVGINQASAVLRAPYGVFHTSDHACAIMESAMREVIAIAEARGVDLSARDIAEWYTFLNTLHPLGKTSMLQDVEAHRMTEVDIFAGKVVALGKEHGIPTPVNEVLLHAIKVIEMREFGE